MVDKTGSPSLFYDHSRYAGNYGDVLKHLVLVRILRYLQKEAPPILYIDTHAGPPGHVLGSGPVLGGRKYLNGIGKLWKRDDAPGGLRDYLDLVVRFNASGNLDHYPGSAWFASQLLRSTDRLCLFDTHADVIDQLQGAFVGQDNIEANKEDGYAACLSRLPPREKSSLVLIDPPYARVSDYSAAIATLREAVRRWAFGVYTLWYPVVDRRRIDTLQNAICDSTIADSKLFELSICGDSDDSGMTGCGMLLVNPPPGLSEELESVLPYLLDVLGDPRTGSYRIKGLAGG